MPRQEEPSEADAGPRWLRDGYVAGIARYGDLAVPFADFQTFVAAASARRAVASGKRASSAGKVARELVVVDLYLACACERGSEQAWTTLREQYCWRIAALLRKRGVPPQRAADIAADLPSKLIAEPGKHTIGRSRLSTFDGSGSLFSWLAVIALRDCSRQSARDLQTLAHDPAAPGGGDAASPELLAKFAEAMRVAWGRLSPRHRTVLVLRYGRGIPGIRIAELMGVGPPRVSRMLNHAVEALREAVEVFVGEGGAELLAHWTVVRDVLGQEMQRLYG